MNGTVAKAYLALVIDPSQGMLETDLVVTLWIVFAYMRPAVWPESSTACIFSRIAHGDTVPSISTGTATSPAATRPASARSSRA
jgi:hypothetical protein